MICPVCEKEVALAHDRFLMHGDCPGGFARVELADSTMESRYTDPTERCPHPERWHSPDWDSAEVEVSEMLHGLVRALQPDVAIETGTAFGNTAHSIGTALDLNGHGILHTVEINPERANEARLMLEGLPVVVEQMSSLDYKPPDGVGFAWFDSLVPLRVQEFRRYYYSFTPGAIVGFHDTNHPGLMVEIEQLEVEGTLLPIELPTPRGLVLGQVIR